MKLRRTNRSFMKIQISCDNPKTVFLLEPSNHSSRHIDDLVHDMLFKTTNRQSQLPQPKVTVQLKV